MKKNNKGFTLIELLAVIVVLSIVLGLTAYIAINAIANAKEKSYQVTINNIENNAGNYLIENSDKLFFISSGDGENEYQCVTIKELIELGYLKNDVTNSQVDKDGVKVNLNNYVYLERNTNSKAITKTHYDPSSEINSACTLATNAVGNIQFVITPNVDTWSNNKTVKVYYKVKNVTAENIGNLTYTYEFENDNGNPINLTGACKNGCDAAKTTKEFNFTTNNVILHSYIKSNDNIIAEGSRRIGNIDNEKPKIELLSYEKKTASDKVKIVFRVTDEGSGLDYKKNATTFKSDIITVKKSDNTTIPSSKLTLTLKEQVSKSAIYQLDINDTSITGNLTIDIPANKLYDKALNSNEAKSFTANIVSTAHYVQIIYNMNGGRLYSEHGQGFNSDSQGNITYNGSTVFDTIEYGQSTNESGLYNWNNANYINLIKDGEYAVKGSEWCTDTEGKGTCFDQSIIYPASDFCDASAHDCTVTLYINWVPKPLRIYYHQNGGTISGYCFAGDGEYKPCTNLGSWAAFCQTGSCPNASDLTYAYQICEYGRACNLWNYNNTSFLNITRSGYYANPDKEWLALQTDDSLQEVSQSTDYTYDELNSYVINETNRYKDLYLYVNWVAKPIYIYYNTYGGDIKDTTNNNRYKKHTNSNGSTDNWVVYTSNNEYVIQKFQPEPNKKYNLWNYDSGGWKFTREGYHAPAQQEWWSRNEDGGYTYFDQGAEYSYEELVASKYAERPTNIEMWMYVNWVKDGSEETLPSEDYDCTWQVSTICGNNTVEAKCGGNMEEEYTSCSQNSYKYRKTCKGKCYSSCKIWESEKIEETNWCTIVIKPGAPSCFQAGTKVKTILGYKNIEDIRIGDRVLSYNENLGINEYKEVINTYNHNNTTDELYNLTIDNHQLSVTSSHRFYIMRDEKTSWIAAKDLIVGDKVMYSNKTYHEIINIASTTKKDNYYNFEVADNHNYYVTKDEILVHNVKTNLPK